MSSNQATESREGCTLLFQLLLAHTHTLAYLNALWRPTHDTLAYLNALWRPTHDTLTYLNALWRPTHDTLLQRHSFLEVQGVLYDARNQFATSILCITSGSYRLSWVDSTFSLCQSYKTLLVQNILWLPEVHAVLYRQLWSCHVHPRLNGGYVSRVFIGTEAFLSVSG
jgi:hypothetical protein